ncbi:unnamed protein product [Debaryomyces tyrocola]|nr:unnamed protein product [Debaryomyces tyrocola]
MDYNGIDSSSVKIHVHLNEILNSDKVVNATLIENYILQLKNNRLIIFPDEQPNESIELNKFISLFIPTINSLLNGEHYFEIDPERVVISLLDTILAYLNIGEILLLYPLDFIINGLTGDSAICCMIIRLLRNNAMSEITVKLFDETVILNTILSRYFEKDVTLNVVNQVELLISELVGLSSTVVSTKLLSTEFRDLYDHARDSEDKLVKFLDYILLLMPYVLEKQFDLPKNYYVLSYLDFSDNDDVLQVVLFIQFYSKLIQRINTFGKDTNIIHNIKPCLKDLVLYFKTRQNDDIVQSFYANDIVDVLFHVSYSKVPELIAFNEEVVGQYELFKSYNLFLHLDCDIKLLSTFNPRALPLEIIEDILQEISIFNQRYFIILLNCIGSENVFNKLIPRLTTSVISKLSFDMLYSLLLRMSEFEYSRKHLINGLPNIVSDYLANPPNVSESEIWNLKKDTLQNLLFSDTDLNVWHDPISKNFSLMCNGRKVQDILPQVDIADKSLQ